MSSGLVELTHLGPADEYLTKDPEITFWKTVYHRHTNHALESIRQDFASEPTFGRRVSATLKRCGDLVTDMHLELTLPPIPNGSIVKQSGTLAWQQGTPTPSPGFYAFKAGSGTEPLDDPTETATTQPYETVDVNDTGTHYAATSSTEVAVFASDGTQQLSWSPTGQAPIGAALNEDGSSLAVVANITTTRTGMPETQSYLPPLFTGLTSFNSWQSDVRIADTAITHDNNTIITVLRGSGVFTEGGSPVSFTGGFYVYKRNQTSGLFELVQDLAGTVAYQDLGLGLRVSPTGQYLITKDNSLREPSIYQWNGSQYAKMQQITGVYGNNGEMDIVGPTQDGKYFALGRKTVIRLDGGTWNVIQTLDEPPGLEEGQLFEEGYFCANGERIFRYYNLPGGDWQSINILYQRQPDDSYTIVTYLHDATGDNAYSSPSPDGDWLMRSWPYATTTVPGVGFTNDGYLVIHRLVGGVYTEFQTIVGRGCANNELSPFSEGSNKMSADNLTMMICGPFVTEIAGDVGRVEVYRRPTDNDPFVRNQVVVPATPTIEWGTIYWGWFHSVRLSHDGSMIVGADTPTGKVHVFEYGGNVTETHPHLQVWDRTGSTWTQTLDVELLAHEILESVTAETGLYRPVTYRGSHIAVGHPREDTGGGATFAFTKSANVWGMTQDIINAHYTTYTAFGGSVALSGNETWLAIGSPGPTYNATASDGGVHMYENVGGIWTFSTTLTGPTDYEFGRSIALANDASVVAATARRDATNDNSYPVHIFSGTPGAWTPQTPIDNGANGYFASGGVSLDQNGTSFLAASPQTRTASIYSINGTLTKTYDFNTFQANSNAPGLYQQASVSLDFNTIVIGDPTAFGGDGSLYVFTVGFPTFTGSTVNDEYYAHVSYVNHIGLAVFRSVDIEIGGRIIDRHPSEFMKMWNDLTTSGSKDAGLHRMLGSYSDDLENGPKTFRGTQAPSTWGAHSLNPHGGTYYIPLQFWFCGQSGSALPLVALQHHDVVVHVDIRPLRQLLRLKAGSDVDVSDPLDGWDIYHAGASADGTPGRISVDDHVKLTSLELWVDYAFLDTAERKTFASTHHDYLIPQVQHERGDSIDPSIPKRPHSLNFNHTVRALYWVILRGDRAFENTDTGNRWFDFGTHDEPARFSECSLILNGSHRFESRNARYFHLVQPFQVHSRVPETQINVYSFALKPEEPGQPSGSLNFSRLDNANLVLRTDASAVGGQEAWLQIYAVNYNVFRVRNGCGGVLFSN